MMLEMLLSTGSHNAREPTWRSLSDPPFDPRYYSSITTIGDKIYVYCGYGNTSNPDPNLFDLWEYTPSTGLWVEKSTTNATIRYGHGGVAIDGKLYILDGVENKNFYSQRIEKYDPSTDEWSYETNTLLTKYGATYAVLDGEIYIFGGANGAGDGQRHRKFWKYSPITNSITELSNFGLIRDNLVSVAINGKIYVFGGRGITNSLFNDLWEYTPSTDSWVQKTSGATYRQGHNAVALNNKMYVFSGFGFNNTAYNGTLNDLWEYDPLVDSWNMLLDNGLQGPQSYIGCSTVCNGKVYTLVGADASSEPFTGFWELTL